MTSLTSKTGSPERIFAIGGPPWDAADEAGLIAFLRGRLPAYMIPAVYTWLDAFPLNASGKVDRKALEAQVATVSGQARDQVPPGTPLEQLLAQVWEEVLGHEPVGLHDDFFALGGNSLHVMQVLAALRSLFERDVPADVVFLASTVEQLITELFPSEAERDAAERVAGGSSESVPPARRLDQRSTAKHNSCNSCKGIGGLGLPRGWEGVMG